MSKEREAITSWALASLVIATLIGCISFIIDPPFFVSIIAPTLGTAGFLLLYLASEIE